MITLDNVVVEDVTGDIVADIILYKFIAIVLDINAPD